MFKRLLFFVCLSVLLPLSFVSAQEIDEKIDLFSVTAQIQESGKIIVTETIRYDFGDNYRHGIFRKIPIRYETQRGFIDARFRLLSVTDENLKKYKIKVWYPGNFAEIRIGDPDKEIWDEYTYIITYEVSNVIQFFEQHDEFYWNVTGNFWQVPIVASDIRIVYPGDVVNKYEVLTKCFTGPIGSTQSECSRDINLDGSLLFKSDMHLNPGEGLSVVLAIPSGNISGPTAWGEVWWFFKNNKIILVPIIVFVVMFYLWRTRGRDLSKTKVIVPQYEGPEGLSPAEVGSVVDETVHIKDITSTLIDLAIRGYVKILNTDKKKGWSLKKLKDAKGLRPFEKKIFNKIFSAKDTVTLKSLEKKLYKTSGDVKSDLYKSMVDKGFFIKNPRKVRGLYYTIGLVLLFLIDIVFEIVAGFDPVNIPVWIISYIVSAIIIIAFGHFMPQKSYKGSKIYRHILGYKMYLSIAEKERIKFHNAPDKNPEEFEKHLPYAIVLGVEKEWAKLFKNIYEASPEWYQGADTHFSTHLFMRDMNKLNSSLNHSFTSGQPSSSYSGGSGFSGGGFSGGGFGGGGGGSW